MAFQKEKCYMNVQYKCLRESGSSVFRKEMDICSLLLHDEHKDLYHISDVNFPQPSVWNREHLFSSYSHILYSVHAPLASPVFQCSPDMLNTDLLRLLQTLQVHVSALLSFQQVGVW